MRDFDSLTLVISLTRAPFPLKDTPLSADTLLHCTPLIAPFLLCPFLFMWMSSILMNASNPCLGFGNVYSRHHTLSFSFSPFTPLSPSLTIYSSRFPISGVWEHDKERLCLPVHCPSKWYPQNSDGGSKGRNRESSGGCSAIGGHQG